MRAASLVPLGFAVGAALCSLLLRHAPADIAVDLAQPLAVVTYWQQFGAQMWLAFALAIAIASIGYVATLRACHPEVSKDGRGIEAPSLRLIMFVSALACAAALLFPVVFSSDVYAYAGYGDMALHGVSPYAHARISVRDPLLDAMLWQWGNPPAMCVYGPAFVWLAQGIVALFLPLGAAAPLWAFRMLACVALVACAPLASAAFSRFAPSTRLAAAAGIALNPIAIWSAAEGHNDTLALAIVLAGFALAARSRVFTGALVIAFSALVKAPGAVAAIAFAIASWRDRTRFAQAAWGAALGIGIVAALAVPLEYGVQAHLAPHGQYFPQFSLQYVSIPLTVVVVIVLLGASTGSAVLRYLSMTHALTRYNKTHALTRYSVTHALTRYSRTPGESQAFAAIALWIAIPNPYPWYAVWLLPLAFLVWRSYAGWALIAASLLIGLRYYGDATTDLSRPLTLAIIVLQFGVPLLLLIAHMVNGRRARREIRTTVPDFAPSHSP
jgi:hypothetical protein